MIVISLKKPKTAQEARANALALADEELRSHGVKVRSKRHPKRLPNGWGDRNRTDSNHHSWKRQRRKQYKEG